MKLLSRIAAASLALCSIAVFGCKPTTTPEAGGGAAQVAPVANNGVAGNYTGAFNKGGTTIEAHPVTVMTDGAGVPQVGLWEFCNVDMIAEGTGHVARPGSSCLVDLGTGNQPHNITSGSATFGENSVNATITFENGTVWTYTGTR